ncbi:MAG: DUF5063 domain-containing protein [Gammaproteobacteria bacterium]|jgi:hypothetical protein
MDDITHTAAASALTPSLYKMANIARDYCQLIDSLSADTNSEIWIRQMGKLLPQLHTAIVLLESPRQYTYAHHLENDDIRCELFLRLNELFSKDHYLGGGFKKDELKRQMCESLAYDFTDMYFDLKRGLELLNLYPRQPNQAANDWRSSFFYHWGRHLVDAESWLYAAGFRDSRSAVNACSSMNSA